MCLDAVSFFADYDCELNFVVGPAIGGTNRDRLKTADHRISRFQKETSAVNLSDLIAMMNSSVFSALSGMRLLACLIVAPRQGYDEPVIPRKSGRSVRQALTACM